MPLEYRVVKELLVRLDLELLELRERRALLVPPEAELLVPQECRVVKVSRV